MHPFGDLSAYLDDALPSEAQASVQAHLDTCALCRTRLAELRGTARLIAALPVPAPSRFLVPRVSVPFWLAPLRTFSTFASGAAIFLFLASAVLSSFPRGMSTGGSAAAPAPNTVSAPQATSALDAASGTASPGGVKLSQPSPAPAPGTERSARSLTPTDSPTEVGRRQDVTAPPSIGYSSTELAAGNRVEQERPPFVLPPWLWLALGVAFGALSFILGRRLRSA